MAMNPMQRKSRNSFLLGMVVTLLITSVIIAILFLQVTKLKDEADKLEKSYVTAYVLNTNIKSGESITSMMVTQERVSKNMLPQDRLTSTIDLTENTIAKIDLQAGTVLSQSMVVTSEEQANKDTRIQEYNMLVLPSQLEVGDYIDIRWMLPNGQDYIVISKKKVIDCNENTIWLNMNEDEILTMSGAVVEAYMATGSKLYAIKYVEPGNQEISTATYMPSNEVIALMSADPNLNQKAIAGINERYNNDRIKTRRANEIQSVLNQYSDNALENIESKVQEEIARQQEARQLYLDQLAAGM